MSTSLVPGQPLSFSGESGTACQTFLDSVTETAFEYNRQFDDAWIAQYAGMLLRGPALVWYTELDDVTQSSWYKLRSALVRVFCADALLAVSPEVPKSAAAAPPPKSASFQQDRSWEPKRGHIRVVADDPNFSGYMSRNLSARGHLQCTAYEGDAASIEFWPTDKPQRVRLRGMSDPLILSLGLHWESWPACSAGAISWGRVVGLGASANGTFISSSKENLRGPISHSPWLVLFDGTFIAIDKGANDTIHHLETYIAKDSGEFSFAMVYDNLRLCLEKYSAKSLTCRARFVFEPL